MTWNYRIVRKEDYLEIHEVFYGTDGAPKMVTTDSVCVGGEDLEELKQDMTHYLEALNKPVLEYDEIGKKSF